MMKLQQLALKPTTEAGAAGVTHEDIMERLKAGDQRFETVESTLKDIGTALKDLHTGQTKIREDIKPVIDDITIIKDWIGAAKAVKIGTRLIKWAGAIAAAMGAIVVAAKVTAAAFARAVL